MPQSHSAMPKPSEAQAAKEIAKEKHHKRRAVEVLTCSICGASDHPTQGCPDTVGATRRSKPEVAKPSNYKSRMCSSFVSGQGCSYGSR